MSNLVIDAICFHGLSGFESFIVQMVSFPLQRENINGSRHRTNGLFTFTIMRVPIINREEAMKINFIFDSLEVDDFDEKKRITLENYPDLDFWV